jgi:hypothetical protein
MVEYGDLGGKKSGHMQYRAKRALGRNAERNDGGRMAVHDCLNVRANPVDFPMDEPLAIRSRRVRINRLAVAVELDDIPFRHQGRWHRARHEIVAWILQ